MQNNGESPHPHTSHILSHPLTSSCISSHIQPPPSPTLQDPLNLAGRELDAFDHVKKEIPTAPVVDPKDSVNVSHVSEDTKRVLAALGMQ